MLGELFAFVLICGKSIDVADLAETFRIAHARLPFYSGHFGER